MNVRRSYVKLSNSLKKFKLIKKKFYQINKYIKAEKLRIVDERGEQIDVLSLKEALQLAKEKELDLVEVAPKAKPPVAKIIDFKKFLYLQKQKSKKAKKLSHKKETKQLRLRPFIDDNDLDFRIKKASRFLKKGHQVKLVVNFYGRELSNKKAGHDLIDRFAAGVNSFGKKKGNPQMKGKSLTVTLMPNK